MWNLRYYILSKKSRGKYLIIKNDMLMKKITHAED